MGREGSSAARMLSVRFSSPRPALDSPPWCVTPDGKWGFSQEVVTTVTAVTNTQQGVYDLTFLNRGSQTIPAGSKLRYRLFDGSQREWTPTPVAATLSAGIAPGAAATVRATIGALTPGQTWTLAWDFDVPGVGLLSGLGVCSPVLRLQVVNQSPTGLSLLSPTVGQSISGTRPYLAATATDPDRWPYAQLRYSFRICANQALTVSCQDSGPTDFTWQVNTPLSWGGHYWWKVTVTDGDIIVDSTSRFTPNDFYVVAPVPDDWRRVGVGLGMATVDGLVLPYGIFTSSATDATLTGAGQGLSIDRVYSSGADGVEGGFGRGWMSIFDARVVMKTSAVGQVVTVTYPDGRQESFGKNSDGSWASNGAVGSTDRLTVDGSGSYAVRESSGVTDYYTRDGDLTKVNYGDSEWQVARSGASNNITTITQMPSGRSFTIGWSANAADTCPDAPRASRPHVTSISVPGDSRSAWTYAYHCSRLVSVTNPEGGRTSYTTDATTFAGTTPTGAPLPGMRSQGYWTYPVSYARQRTITLTVPGSVDRKVTITESTSSSTYLNAINSYGGPVVTYCEYRSIVNGTESCSTNQTRLRFDTSLRALVKQVSAPGAAQSPSNSRYWSYSALNGQLMGFVDENGNVVGYNYDGYGNPEGTYVYRDANTQVTSTTFFRTPTASDPEFRIAGSALSPTQAGRWRADMYTYDAQGHLIQRVGNATAAAPSGEVSQYAYTTSASPAYSPSNYGLVSGSHAPAGLLASESTAGGTATYRYGANGDLLGFSAVGRSGSVRTYDNRGQVVAETTGGTSSTSATTTFVRDGLGRVTRQDDQCVTNPITGANSKKVTTRAYNADGLVATLKELALDCSTGNSVAPDRITTYEYDSVDRLIKSTGPTGAVTTYTYDAANPTQLTSTTDPRGRKFDYTYSAFNGKVASETSDVDDSGTRTHRLTHSYQYDPAGRLISESDAVGRVTTYTYTWDNLLKSATRKNVSNTRGLPVRDMEMWRGTYDGRGNLTSETIGGLHRTDYVYDSEGRLESTTVDPAGLKRRTTVTRDPQGRVIGTTTSDGTRTESTSYTVDAAGNAVTATVENGAVDITAKYLRDANELITGVVDPTVVGTGQEQDGTSSVNYDALGRVTDATGPSFDQPTLDVAGTLGGASTVVRAHATAGYDAFGDLTEIRDPNGNVSKLRYDAAGHRIAQIRPDYTGGTAATLRGEVDFTYSAAGDLSSTTDERGMTTRYTYDISGNQTRIDVDLGGGKTRSTVSTYTPAGQLRAVTETRGATTDYQYDELGRLVWAARLPLEEPCCSDGPVAVPTVLEYDDAGDVTDIWDRGVNGQGPLATDAVVGAHTHLVYNAAGELISRTDPGVAHPVVLERDLRGRVVGETSAAGVRTEHLYDLAGREISTTRVGTDGTRLTQTYQRDADGRITSQTRPNGQQRTWVYDRAGHLSSLTEQLTATTFRTVRQGFDAGGRLIKSTDANGHTTWTLYNAWGLIDKTIIPSAPQASILPDRMYQYTYEPGGEVASLISPGQNTRRYTYDIAGQLTSITASTGADYAGTLVERHLSYTNAGDIASIDTANGTERYRWGSWGQLLNAAGPLMNADYGYDDLMRPNEVTRSSVAATGSLNSFSFFYDTSGRPNRVTGGVNGKNQSVTRQYDPNTGAVAQDASTSNDVVSHWQNVATAATSYTYDAFGRKASDTVTNAAATQSLKTQYGYDSVDNLTSKTTTGRILRDGGTYGYDLASRLTSWQPATPAGAAAPPAALTYTWDDANNRKSVSDGTRTQTWFYDQRDRITGSVVETPTTTDQTIIATSNARGDLTALGSRTFTYNSLDELTTDGTSSYGYDSLGRLATRGNQTLLYDGLSSDNVGTYGTSGFTETSITGPGGLPTLNWNLTNNNAGTLVTNSHTDITARVDTMGAIGSGIAYDPFGARATGSVASGPATYNGYQSDWTDPTSGAVRMGSRWYEPTLGRFLTRDTIDLPLTDGGSPNHFGYGNANPVNNTDPTGHFVDPGSLVGALEAFFISLAEEAGISGSAAITIGEIATGATEVAALDTAASVAIVGAPEVLAVVGTIALGSLLFASPSTPMPSVTSWISPPTTAPASPSVRPHTLTASSTTTSTQPGTYPSVRTVSITNGIRTTTETYWGTRTTETYQEFADATWHRHATSTRVMTGMEWFSEPVVNPGRPGLALAQSPQAANTLPTVLTPARATSTAAGSCGLGGSIASCQTPSLGAGLCGSLTAVTSLCAPAEPTPGRAEGTQANVLRTSPQSSTLAPPQTQTSGGSGGRGLPPSGTSSTSSSCDPDPEDETPDSLQSYFKDGRIPTASELAEFARGQGWIDVTGETGPVKFVDSSGVLRLTLKMGSERTPGSETPHVEVRHELGHRIDPATGEPTSRKSPGNHREITWDCE